MALFFWAYFFARQIFLLLEMTKGQGDDPLSGCVHTPQGKARRPPKVLYLLLENSQSREFFVDKHKTLWLFENELD